MTNAPWFDRELVFAAGHHQQHHHPKHDLHQNLTQVRSVGGQSGQHRLRPGLLLRGPSEQSESGPSSSSAQIVIRVCADFSLSAVCWQVCGVQRSGAVRQREISGEDGVNQHTLAGINHTRPAQTSVCVCARERERECVCVCVCTSDYWPPRSHCLSSANPSRVSRGWR